MIEGYTPHFIGRRRELQRLLPGLRAGELQAVVLTGLGGTGKSTLATRLARKLEANGWTPLALSYLTSAHTLSRASHYPSRNRLRGVADRCMNVSVRTPLVSLPPAFSRPTLDEKISEQVAI